MPLPSVSDAEMSVLQLLWKRQPLTARQVTAELYPGQSASDVATVQKLIHRLEEKGLVARDRSSHAHLISPLISQDEFAAQRMMETAEQLTQGSLKPLFAHLLDTDQLSIDELEDIRKMINQHRRKRT